MDLSTIRLGYYAAAAAFIASIGFDVAQTLQVIGVLKFPYDAILIYGFSLLIPVPFIFAMLALHYTTASDKKIWSHAALIFTVLYAAYVSLNYVVQLATVIPMTLRGRLDEVRVLDQTPHSLFWDIDAMGYIFMGLATLCGAAVFAKHGLEKWVRWFFLANFWMTPVIAVVYFYPTFSIPLLIAASPWIITASGSLLLLALFFKQRIGNGIN